MRACPKCGKQFTLNERLCPHDGSTLENVQSTEERNLGKVLAGKYRIEGFLKRGGMGAVYRATHVMLDKPVAIKLIKPELVTSEDTVRRFQREARAASHLSHPNVVTVYDLGQTEDGTLYIAMELVEGDSLKDLVRREGPLEPSRAIHIVDAVAGALEIAHRNNIIHRDLKPQNIMMTLDSQGREAPKLLDFGIAKTFEPESPALTSTGMVLGTPHYMAPEQAAGKPVDARSDIYSLGIILYEMLVGKVPFDDPSIPAILVKHLNEPPKRPSELREGLPSSLEHIVLRCLEKDPERRFGSAQEFRAALSAADSTVAAVAEGPTVGIPAMIREPLPFRAETRPPPIPPTVVRAPAPAVATTPPTVREPKRVAPPRKALRPALGGLFALLLLVSGSALYLYLGRSGDDSPSTESQAAVPAIPGPEGRESAVPRDEIPAEEEDAMAVPSETVEVEEPATPAPVPVKPAERPRRAGETTSSPSRPAAVEPHPTPPPEAPAAPTPDPPPAVPSVSFGCQGLSDACGSIENALESAAARKGMSIVDAEDAEIVLTLLAEEIEARSEQQFGTTFVVRTYSIEVSARASRFNERVSMPPPETFSFDTRFGREKLAERSRVLADAVAEKILDYWAAKR